MGGAASRFVGEGRRLRVGVARRRADSDGERARHLGPLVRLDVPDREVARRPGRVMNTASSHEFEYDY